MILLLQTRRVEPGWARPVSPLVTCVCIGILSCPALASYKYTWPRALSTATAYVLVLSLLSTGLGRLAGLSFQETRRIAAAGLWLSPLMIFAIKGSVFYLAAAAFSGAATARALRTFQYNFIQPDDNDVPSGQRMWVFAGAVLLHIAALAAANGTPVASAAALLVASFFIAWYVPWRNPSSPSLRSMAATVLTAILVTTYALNPSSHTMFPPLAAADKQGSRARTNNDLYSGFILKPERERHVHLVAPTPSKRSSSFGLRPTALLTIPFSGDYYIFYWPMSRPPKSSFVTRGTPIDYNFTSPDRTPLRMEARQTLEELIDLECCSRMDVSIRSTDALPESIALELIVGNSETPRGPVISLGEQQLQSSGTLQFDVPLHPAIRAFNEIRIVFHLVYPRANRGANVAIEQFVLLPRTL